MKYLDVIEPGVRMIILPKLIERFLKQIFFHTAVSSIPQHLSDGSDSFDTKMYLFQDLVL